MTRAWPFPDLRNGVTLHHISDTHSGAREHAAFVQGWLDSVGDDLDFLKVASNSGHVHTGDMIEWFAPYADNAGMLQETAWYTAWRDAVKATDGRPWAEACGNHDMLGPSNGTQRTGRTAQDWANSIGIASQNMVHDMGEVKVITLGPDEWFRDIAAGEAIDNFVLPQATLDWLDTQLQAAGKPCFIACHIVLQEQYPSINEDGYNAANVNNPGLTDLLISNPNAVGWLSGHKHINIQTQPDHATVMTLGGSKKMFAINAPGAAGGKLGGVADADHQWQSVNQSVFLTYFGDALDVRWRDHNKRAWTGPGTERVRHLILPA